jgi:hypothetical protein
MRLQRRVESVAWETQRYAGRRRCPAWLMFALGERVYLSQSVNAKVLRVPENVKLMQERAYRNGRAQVVSVALCCAGSAAWAVAECFGSAVW